MASSRAMVLLSLLVVTVTAARVTARMVPTAPDPHDDNISGARGNDNAVTKHGVKDEAVVTSTSSPSVGGGGNLLRDKKCLFPIGGVAGGGVGGFAGMGGVGGIGGVMPSAGGLGTGIGGMGGVGGIGGVTPIVGGAGTGMGMGGGIGAAGGAGAGVGAGPFGGLPFGGIGSGSTGRGGRGLGGGVPPFPLP